MKKDLLIKKYFNQKEKLSLNNNAYLEQVKKFTQDLLENDITSNAVIKGNKKAQAKIFSKEQGIVAGLAEVVWFLEKNNIKIKKNKKDGDAVKENEQLLLLSGKIKDILKTERIALNLLQRMSGIATQTFLFTKKIKHRALICPTRKTLYGMLDKKAVTIGNGGTHRLGLHDFILIKDNHLAFLKNKIEKVSINLNKKKLFWEIEVKNKKEAYWAAHLKPGAIMFDNFKPKEIKRAINNINKYYPDIIFEASGGITLKNIKKYKKIGVDIISCGSLTHSIKALDMSLDIL
jgi:nicotinate-nucleotide pyrophosphorylase (carboxylating)